MSVVGDDSWPLHALDDAELREMVSIRICRVFGPTIAVEDQPRGRATTRDGLVECSHRQGQVTLSAQAPAEQSPRMLVEDNSQIVPTASDVQVSDVPDPNLICTAGRDVELSVRQLAKESLHRRFVAVATPCAGLQPRSFHETSNALSCDADAALLQGGMNARASVCAAAGVEDGPDLCQQLFVF